MAIAEQYVTIGVGGDLFAAPVGQVREILELGPLARAPRAPPALLGMIDVRGRSVPVLDLRDLLGLPREPDDVHTRVIVLDVGGEGGAEGVVALKSDRVYEVTALDSDDLDAPLATPDGRSTLVRGIGRRAGRFVTVLDMARVVEGFVGDGAAAEG